ncbi:hypothetical protein POJ06DRAFT_258994 [Lipomyces tetrasporus]|uniref:Transcription elongation factor SPT5 n=1 Tax=Lipomyces tetrasporus TaxID=54092 RepID=A0AAD7QNE7_9ASCO|nr:uncharacterized protein POJ06DRAFT_258994 [Lipomyces tetrasporus]KAJ8098268.1 hypothetical protein POJ06DRAFT_258994 [Lipomyces tetrasporus]
MSALENMFDSDPEEDGVRHDEEEQELPRRQEQPREIDRYDEGDGGKDRGNSGGRGAERPRSGDQDLDGGDVDDEDDEDDEDEDDEEDEEDEESEVEEDGTRRRKRPRRERRNQFLDVEAEVDEDEEELEEDEDELGREDGFIQDEGQEGDFGRVDDRLHREVDRQRAAIAEADAERLASEYREKYGRSAASKYRGEMNVVPQRLLVPSVNDPNIWGIRCKPGKEKAIVRTIWRKKASLQYSNHPLEILSAFQRDNFSGYVYVEARKMTDVEYALKGIVNVYARQMILVPIPEYTDLLRVNKGSDVELVPGSYVRIKRGKYQGDLAVVEDLSENGLEAQLKLVPRLDYGRTQEILGQAGIDGKRKRSAKLSSRPAARLFSPMEARMSDPKNWQQRQAKDNHYIFQGEEYINGYLIKDFRIAHLITENVEPTLEEVTKFSSTADDEGIDLQSLALSLKQASSNATFQPGDHVEVHEGEQTGVYGRVVSIDRDIVSLRAETEGLKGQLVEIPSKSLRKKFNQGDHVRVIGGKYKDETGMVVRIKDDVVTIIGDLSMAEITVFSKDLKEASDIGGRNSLGKYQIHDLVQLSANNVACIIKVERDAFRVLDINGAAQTILPSAITMKVDNKFSFATDRNGSEIRVGDTVKETDGEGRQGVILHIYRTYAFLHDRSQNENAGVSLVRTRNVTAIAAKGGRITGSSNGPDLTKMNPRMQIGGEQQGMLPPTIPRQGGRDRTIGQTVKVRQGPYKGLLGIVKDATDAVARIELHSKSKIISIEKTKLGFVDSRGNKTISYEEFVTPKKFLNGNVSPMPQYQGGTTPSWLGGQTPARTPAWATSGDSNGGRTPAWAAQDGGRTPAWSASSSRTPAWNAGGKTPAYGSSGNRTPAWNPGARTPGRSAWDTGSRTPRAQDHAWNDEPTARTPWEDPTYGRTPGAYNAAPTPGAISAPTPGDISAPTPGRWDDMATPAVYDAKTPGIAAATPAAWGDEPETPRYAPASP